MTLIEITLFIIILILIVVLINQDNLTNIIRVQRAKHKAKIDITLELLKKLFGIFRKVRRFSLIYIFNSNFYKVYLVFAISVIFTKIFLHYNAHAIFRSPVWLGNIVDFLIVSSAREIICVLTKIIDDQISIN